MCHNEFVLATVLAVIACPGVLVADIAELAKAEPGTVVELPAGTFAGGFAVPPGVTLRGAGYQRTMIEVRGTAAAIRVEGRGARIEDLCVRGSGVGIELSAAEDVAIQRVMILGGTTGIQAGQVDKASIENVIVARTLIGISLNQATRSTVANCTVFTTGVCGLSLSHTSDTTAFNNLVVNAGTGVVLGGQNRNLALDYNLYQALAIGKIEGQLQRPSVPTWRDVTGGLDAHSLQMNVVFANSSRNDFHPVSTLNWNPSRIVTADWGVAELAGHEAPATDIDGQPRVGACDLGAFEALDMPSRPADGKFQVVSDEGLKSAGLFTPSGSAVYYLFHGLPLKKGEHEFTLPARDLFGRPIPPETYELRLVESAVDWTYRGMVANSGAGTRTAESDSVHVGLVAYTPDNQLLTASGWSERHINLRLGDPATGKARWVFEGSADSTGLC
ncbi:MAG: right-handed parallel beta-helix repeat-containing protein, partial [Planctomycetes bacterium]|nr:right-handed parallel beta-helix repeat-containing protein [Planctomycetota bacterium]